MFVLWNRLPVRLSSSAHQLQGNAVENCLFLSTDDCRGCASCVRLACLLRCLGALSQAPPKPVFSSCSSPLVFSIRSAPSSRQYSQKWPNLSRRCRRGISRLPNPPLLPRLISRASHFLRTSALAYRLHHLSLNPPIRDHLMLLAPVLPSPRRL